MTSRCRCSRQKSPRERYCFACTFEADPGSLYDRTDVFTYFFCAPQRPHDVWIGKTASIEKRRYDHQRRYPGGDVVRVFGGNFEKELHARFAEQRLDASFFRRYTDIETCMRAPLAEVATILRMPKNSP